MTAPAVSGALPASPAPVPASRATLVEAILGDDPDERAERLRELADAEDPMLVPVLTAWRGGSLYLDDSAEPPVPFLLDPQEDEEGRSRGIRVADGAFLLDEDGNPRWFESFELFPVDSDNDVRRLVKTILDLATMSSGTARARADAIRTLGLERNPEYLPRFEARLEIEESAMVRRALREAQAVTRMAGDDSQERLEAVRELGLLRSIGALGLLRDLSNQLETDPDSGDPELRRALRRSIAAIENHMAWGSFFGTAFRGLSLGAVLLIAALGLAITFGLMGVINMAHGEVMMVGAYSAYVMQTVFAGWFGTSGTGFDLYFLAAIPFSFLTAGLVGLALERGVIRFLYRRPLESLLATWGVSLLLQQLFRHVFGAANVQVSSPSWLSGSLVIRDVLLAYNRMFVIAFALSIVLGTYLLLTRTSLGLQIRAVMQNRPMASALGVRTERVNMLTFAFGSGLAGMAGACLSQLGNVGPSLGQSHIVDCFMVVVLGGIGSLVGTVFAALGIGFADQILQPWMGAVMGKITVLTAIILFLQWRPSGLVAIRSRNLEG
ncbi:MAG: urea ABC transporter permease subunit UrtB [Verrucomicrobiae bacterium]|nr:urea ABC transporter permease subunit UrtB [Verrucomicrobiae bacterium]